MTLQLNGEKRELKEGETLADLVRELSLEDRPIAVELNRDVVPKTKFGETRLAEGDQIEIVTLVGGG